GDRRACWNVSTDIECEHTATEFAHGGLAGEKVIAKSIALIAIRNNVLIQCVVLTGVDIDNVRNRQTGTDTDKHDYKDKREFGFKGHTGLIEKLSPYPSQLGD